MLSLWFKCSGAAGLRSSSPNSRTMTSRVQQTPTYSPCSGLAHFKINIPVLWIRFDSSGLGSYISQSFRLRPQNKYKIDNLDKWTQPHKLLEIEIMYGQAGFFWENCINCTIFMPEKSDPGSTNAKSFRFGRIRIHYIKK